MLSRIKSSIERLFSEKYRLSSFLNLSREDITKFNIKSKEDVVININNINITISPEGDLTIEGVRILDLNTEYTFINCPDKEFKELAKDSETFQAKYEQRRKELEEKYEYHR